MNNANELAKLVISISAQSGKNISNLKLQKVLYYIQGFHLVLFSTEAFPEPIKAWKLGPVVEDVYHQYKRFGKGEIVIDNLENLSNNFEKSFYSFVKNIVEVSSQFSPYELVDITHQEEPWQTTTQNQEIPKIVLKRYFANLTLSVVKYYDAFLNNKFIPKNNFFEKADYKRISFYNGILSTFDFLSWTNDFEVGNDNYYSNISFDNLNLRRDLANISYDQEVAISSLVF